MAKVDVKVYILNVSLSPSDHVSSPDAAPSHGHALLLCPGGADPYIYTSARGMQGHINKPI